MMVSEGPVFFFCPGMLIVAHVSCSALMVSGLPHTAEGRMRMKNLAMNIFYGCLVDKSVNISNLCL